LSYFKDLPDPRQRGKVVYPLDEVLLLCLLASGTCIFSPCQANKHPQGPNRDAACAPARLFYFRQGA